MKKQKLSKASKVVLDATINPNTGVYEVFREVKENNWDGYTYTWESTPGSAKPSQSYKSTGDEWKSAPGSSPHSGRWTTLDEIYERNKDTIAKDMKRIFEEAIRG